MKIKLTLDFKGGSGNQRGACVLTRMVEELNTILVKKLDNGLIIWDIQTARNSQGEIIGIATLKIKRGRKPEKEIGVIVLNKWGCHLEQAGDTDTRGIALEILKILQIK